MTLRVFEAFSGVGSQRMALRNLGIDYEVVATFWKSYERLKGVMKMEVEELEE